MNFSFDPTWATVYLTGLLVLVTTFYAWVTLRLQQATKLQANIQTKALDLQSQSLALQNRLVNAQLLAQRFDMYWRARAPVTDQELSDVDLIPDDYMDPNTYLTKYKTDRQALGRYVYLCTCYE